MPKHHEHEAEFEQLRQQYNAAVANGLRLKAKRFARQINAVERKLK